ncbi:MAG: histidinol-phosphate transaminase [Alphaproteobacteria bacterium]|nr:histidinol-phosphate transaminase [Alphaproteobacteria bacterium]
MSASPPQKPSPKPIVGILDTPLYVGGRSSIAGHSIPAGQAEKAVYKLSANENALGASAEALAVLAQNQNPAIYPDGHSTALRDGLADAHNIEAARIVCGTGSGDLLQLLAHGFLQTGDEFIFSEYGFLLYELAGRSTGATPIKVAENDLTIDVDAMLAAVSDKTKMVFIANPNNPTGTMLGGDEIMRLHAGLRVDIVLVIDEAYWEYVEAEFHACDFAWAGQYENIVITRTFSKAYGLAALRLGWCYCPLDIAAVLNRLRGPFNVSALAQNAGLAAVRDTEHLGASHAHNRQWRDWLRQQLAALDINVRPSHANFILLEFGDSATAQAVDDFLGTKNIIVRGLAAFGLAHALRLTIGTEAANRAVVEALSEFQAEFQAEFQTAFQKSQL